MDRKIDIEEDLPFQDRQWRLERIGHLLIACCLAVALLGLFGHGPLSTGKKQTEDGRITIHYDRFARLESRSKFLVSFEPAQDEDGVVRLWFDQDYLDAFKVVAVSPVPLWGEARDGGRAFVFQTDGSRFTAALSVQFQAVGIVRGSVSVDEGQSLSLTHFVWP